MPIAMHTVVVLAHILYFNINIFIYIYTYIYIYFIFLYLLRIVTEPFFDFGLRCDTCGPYNTKARHHGRK